MDENFCVRKSRNCSELLEILCISKYACAVLHNILNILYVCNEMNVSLSVQDLEFYLSRILRVPEFYWVYLRIPYPGLDVILDFGTSRIKHINIFQHEYITSSQNLVQMM